MNNMVVIIVSGGWFQMIVVRLVGSQPPQEAPQVATQITSNPAADAI